MAAAALCALCVCGPLSILFRDLQCESNWSTFLEYIIADININISFYGEQLKFLSPQVFQFCKAHALSILCTSARMHLSEEPDVRSVFTHGYRERE